MNTQELEVENSDGVTTIPVATPVTLPLSFTDYQKRAGETAIYPGRGSWVGLVYTALGLGEAGELQGKAKKLMRDDNFELTVERREAMAKELGDVLWYAAQLAHELGADLGEIAQANLDKLAKRKEDGTLKGSGDDR